ncbi:SDR family NAD(P)-dependent oxidoreductase [Amycolatopsis pithecellobii]|uniref:SDR family oxidoreductase n=1 Tax=Amycolatopsis pithecellobii TaxID=664692 RepID=A0A6N7YIT0_9PSEU|nr:SDR family oxidoreductase [Amycolatopsis pithecellobii]MTD52825.1 SDR family oxidoreductase [Amycolatopsis pithecellobii]
MSTLTGKVAIVTGASKGIGAGIARALGAAGATVVVDYSSDEQGAAATVSAITDANGKAIAIQADVSQPGDVTRLFEEAGPVDILVNNAAAYSLQPFEDITVAEFHRQYEVNVLGTILTSQAFSGQAGDRGGAIINILTAGITANLPGQALYTSTKGALTNLTRVLANELAPRGIRVNAIAPGATDTEGSRAQGLFEKDLTDAVVSRTPLGRIGHPDDIGPVATFLASDDARWVTGDVIFASGGLRS